MQSSKKFGVWCVVAAVVAMCLGMLSGMAVVSAQEPQDPMEGQYEPPATPAVDEPAIATMPDMPIEGDAEGDVTETLLPPVPSDLQLYQQYLARLFQIKAEIESLQLRITIHQILLAAEPDNLFIQNQLSVLWWQLFMLEMELTEVRSVLTTLNP